MSEERGRRHLIQSQLSLIFGLLLRVFVLLFCWVGSIGALFTVLWVPPKEISKTHSMIRPRVNYTKEGPGAGRKLGLQTTAALFIFGGSVLLPQARLGTITLAGGVAHLRGCGKEAAAMCFWVHIFTIFLMAEWIVVYLGFTRMVFDPLTSHFNLQLVVPVMLRATSKDQLC